MQGVGIDEKALYIKTTGYLAQFNNCYDAKMLMVYILILLFC